MLGVLANCLQITGVCPELKRPSDPEPTIVVNLGQYTPWGGFEPVDSWG